MANNYNELDYPETDLVIRPEEYDELKNIPISLETLPKICEILEFPEFNGEILKDIHRLRTFLLNLKIEYQNMGMIIPNLSKCEELYNKIQKHKEMEKECDKLEVQMCRTHEKYLNVKKIQNMDNNQLQQEYNNLKEKYKNLIQYIDNINYIIDKLKQAQQDNNKEYLSFLSLHNDYTPKKNIVKNKELELKAEKIRNKTYKKIYFLLSNNKTVPISLIQAETTMERNSILKIIYSLVNQGIILFDRIKDEASFLR